MTVAPAGTPVTVLTWNVRRRLTVTWPPADRWDRRAPLVAAVLAAEQPALVGLQEVLPSQLPAIVGGLGADYGRVGHGRQPGPRDEACPLFYDRRRLELVRWRQRALSERPDVAGSRSWGNVFPRVLVEASLRDLVSGAVFLAVNTHLDVLSSRARRQSARVIAERVRTRGQPSIVMGDLNATPGSAPLVELTRGGTLRDAWTSSRHRTTPAWGTRPGYRAARHDGPRIDHILVSPGVEVLRVGILDTRPDGARPSDHLPVRAAVRLPATDRSAP